MTNNFLKDITSESMKPWILVFLFTFYSSLSTGEVARFMPAPPSPPTPVKAKAPAEPISPKASMQAESPWFTGSLIVPSGTVVPYGDFMIQTYVYVETDTGIYNDDWRSVPASENFYSLNPQILCYFGLTPWCDINIIPQFFYNTTSNQHSCQFGDFTVGFDFQLMKQDYTPYFPGILFAIREVFPTGNFQNLHAEKRFTDLSGAGTFATEFNLVFYKIFKIYDLHFLSMSASVQYTIATAVGVHGFNAYGGGFGTKGKALPGNTFQGILSFEYALSRNWVLALDSVYTHTEETQFYGTAGTALDGSPAIVGLSSSEQLSFAPAIEYNFSGHFGIIAGCWFSAIGRNSAEFRSGVVNFEYTY